MPRRSAAWMIVTPSSTSIVRPSISTVGMGSHGRRLGAQRTAAERGVLLELGAELGGEGAGGHGGSVGERADGVALDVVGDVQQQVDVGRCRAPILQAPEDAVEPAGSLPARRTLPARFVVEEA